MGDELSEAMHNVADIATQFRKSGEVGTSKRTVDSYGVRVTVEIWEFPEIEKDGGSTDD